jgi:hypothetical protein
LITATPSRTEKFIGVDDVMEPPKLADCSVLPRGTLLISGFIAMMKWPTFCGLPRNHHPEGPALGGNCLNLMSTTYLFLRSMMRRFIGQ